MNKKNKVIMITSLIVMLIIAIFGISYAYFTAIVSGGDKGSSIIIQTGSLRLLYEDTEYINVSNILPGTTFTKTIKVTNEGNVPVNYDLLWLELNNTFENRSDLVMSMTCSSSTDTCNNYPETIIAYKGTNIPIMDHISIDGLEEHTYVVTITFKETRSNQDENQGRTLSGKIGILESDNYSSTEEIKGVKLVSINAAYNNNEIHTQGQVINKDDLVVNAVIMDEVSVTHNVKLNNNDYQIKLQDNKVPNDASGTVPIKVTYNYNGTTKSNAFNVTTAGSGTYDYPSMMAWNSYPTTDFHAYKSIITQIDFVNNVNTTDSTSVWDISADQSSRVIAWLDKDNSSHLYIGSESNQIIMTSGDSMFSGFFKLTTINFNNMVDTSNVFNMYEMFYNCYALTSLDLSSFDISKVSNMSYMFFCCSALKSLDLSNFDVSNVKYMSYMFSNTYIHQAIARTQSDADKYNTSADTTYKFYPGNISVMNSRRNSNYSGEYYAYKSTITTIDYVSSIDISNAHEYWDMSNALDGSIIAWINNGDLNHLYIGTNNNKIKISSGFYMFFDFNALTTINNINMLDTSDVTNMQYMFYNCKVLTSLDVISFDTSKVTDMGSMFNNCEALISLDLSGFDNANTTTKMNYMFYGCTALKILDLSDLTMNDTTTNVSNMFTSVTLNEQGSYAKNSTSAANLNTLSNSNAFRVKS